MWEDILKLALANGLWATLCVGLLIYLLRENKKRETAYQITIEALCIRLESMARIEKDCKSILQAVGKKNKEKICDYKVV